jgi:hypothetical protein
MLLDPQWFTGALAGALPFVAQQLLGDPVKSIMMALADRRVRLIGVRRTPL